MQTIGVNIVPGNFPQFVRYSQNDIGREFKINVVDFDIPSGATVECVATKPSGLGFTVSGTVTDNTVSFITTAIMTDEWGKFPAELRISSGGEVLGTANFMFIGERNPHPEGTTDGQQGTIIPELTLLVNEIRESNARVAEMTASAHTSDVPTAEYDADTNNLEFGIPSISEEEFLKAFVTDSASGSIASITDGGDGLPVKSLSVNIVPKQSGSGDPSPSNVRPISGYEGVNVTRCGKNFLNLDTEHIAKPSWYPGGWSVGGLYGSNGYVANRDNTTGGAGGVWADLKAGTYTISGEVELGKCTQVRLTLVNYGHTDTYFNITPNAQGKIMQTIVLPNDGSYVFRLMPLSWASGVTKTMWFDKLQLELDSTATAYEPYQGTSYPISLGQTVYGGTLEVMSGKLTDEMRRIDLGSLNWDYLPVSSSFPYGVFYTALYWKKYGERNFLTDCYKLSNNDFSEDKAIIGNAGGNTIYIMDSSFNGDTEAFKASLNGRQMVYERKDPTEITLTPTQVETLLGNNNIYSSCGDVEVEYRADTKLYIDKLLGNTRTVSMAMAPETTEETTEEPAEDQR